MLDSAKEYVSTLGYWSLVVIAAAAVDALGVFQVATGRAGGPLPGWILISMAFLVALVVPFIAFHRMRTTMLGVTDERRRELERLIIRAKEATHRLVAKWEATRDASLLEQERQDYDKALSALRIEADLEGREIKKAGNRFLYFVAEQTMRFVAVDPPHRQPMATGYFKGTNKDDVPDSFHFMARLQEKAEEAIEALSP